MNKTPPNTLIDYRVFYESVGKLYPEEKVVFGTLRGLLRKQFVLKYLTDTKGCLLDLGCNRGYYISNYLNGRAIGIDIAFSVLQTAKTRNPGASFFKGDAQNLSFLRPNSINSILCSELIEHVPNSQSVITECYRVLKSGGNLLITTPNYKIKRPDWVSVGEMKKYGVKGVESNLYFHTAYRPEELKDMAEQAGFRVIEMGTFEKEVKYSTRIPVIFYYIIHVFNRYFLKNETLDDFNEKLLQRSSLLVYRMCKALGLNSLFVSFVSEGVRTYLIAQKS